MMNKTPEYQLKANKTYRNRHKFKQYNRNVPEEFFKPLDDKLAQLRIEHQKKEKEVNKQ